MNKTQALQYINAQATTPDQLLSYVDAVSGAKSELFEDYIVHRQNNSLVLIGYPLQDPYNTKELDAVINKLLARKDAFEITVLAPIRPTIAPQKAISTEDAYWILPLPEPKLNVKVRNMLTRAEHEVDLIKKSGQGAWTSLHQELMLSYIRNKNLNQALCSIMQRLGTYIINSQDVMLFSAYTKNSQNLLAFALADFSSFSMAFYMFAFRQASSSPGVADAVLYALLNEAKSRGFSQCNLGLGINSGIEFFKKKWGAKPSLPFVQTNWQIESQNKTWFSRFLD